MTVVQNSGQTQIDTSHAAVQPVSAHATAIAYPVQIQQPVSNDTELALNQQPIPNTAPIVDIQQNMQSVMANQVEIQNQRIPQHVVVQPQHEIPPQHQLPQVRNLV